MTLTYSTKEGRIWLKSAFPQPKTDRKDKRMINDDITRTVAHAIVKLENTETGGNGSISSNISN